MPKQRISGTLRTVRRSVFALLCLLSALPPALAADSETCASIFDDTRDALRVGDHPIGKPLLSIMSKDEIASCHRDNMVDATCYFKDSAGAAIESFVPSNAETGEVQYLFEEAVVELTQASSDGAPHAHLPAGISFGESLSVVLKKLTTVSGGPSALQIERSTSGDMLETGWCVRSSYGALWHLELSFDASHGLIHAYAIKRDYDPYD